MYNFREISASGKTFVKPKKWKDFSNGDFVIGFKQECKELDKYKKPIFKLIVKETNFGMKEGEELYLNCGGNFQNLFNQVEEGETCRITYNGMNKMTGGEWQGEKTHAIKVEIIPDESEEESEELI